MTIFPGGERKIIKCKVSELPTSRTSATTELVPPFSWALLNKKEKKFHRSADCMLTQLSNNIVLIKIIMVTILQW